jgi:hypothetical protein
MRSFKELMREELLAQAEQLVRFLTLDAPPTLIGKQVAMIVESSVGFCGSGSAYHHLQESIYQRLSIKHGFCVACDRDEPRRATTPLGFCDICATRLSQNDV